MKVVIVCLICASSILADVYNRGTGLPSGWGANGRNYNYGPTGKFYGKASAQTTLLDAHGGTNGVVPNVTTVGASTYGSWPALTINTTVMGANMLYSNYSTPQALAQPATIGGVNYGASSGLGFGGVLSGGGTGAPSMGPLYVQSGAPADGAYAIGFYVYTDCVANIGQDCGALGGAWNTNGEYSVIHFVQVGATVGCMVALENQPGGTINYYPAPCGVKYRVNILQAKTGQASFNGMKLCDSNHLYLYDWSMTTGTGGGNWLAIGITGQEPAVAGVNVVWQAWTWGPASLYTQRGACF